MELLEARLDKAKRTTICDIAKEIFIRHCTEFDKHAAINNAFEFAEAFYEKQMDYLSKQNDL